MDDVELFAGIAVSDLPRAASWYDALFGEVETFSPNDTERVWTIGAQRHVYVELDPARAGGSMVTLFVPDLDAVVAAVAARGLEPETRLTYENGVRKAVFRDPDGNEVGLGGAPSGA